jgi:glutamyl-tRNA reductase
VTLVFVVGLKIHIKFLNYKLTEKMSHGLIGLGAMGANLARNIQKNDKLHVYNRSQDKVNALVYECP